MEHSLPNWHSIVFFRLTASLFVSYRLTLSLLYFRLTASFLRFKTSLIVPHLSFSSHMISLFVSHRLSSSHIISIRLSSYLFTSQCIRLSYIIIYFPFSSQTVTHHFYPSSYITSLFFLHPIFLRHTSACSRISIRYPLKISLDIPLVAF